MKEWAAIGRWLMMQESGRYWNLGPQDVGMGLEQNDFRQNVEEASQVHERPCNRHMSSSLIPMPYGRKKEWTGMCNQKGKRTLKIRRRKYK